MKELRRRRKIMLKETIETLIEDLRCELVNRQDGTDRYDEVRISYLKRAIKELKIEEKNVRTRN